MKLDKARLTLDKQEALIIDLSISFQPLAAKFIVVQ